MMLARFSESSIFSATLAESKLSRNVWKRNTEVTSTVQKALPVNCPKSYSTKYITHAITRLVGRYKIRGDGENGDDLILIQALIHKRNGWVVLTERRDEAKSHQC